MSTISEALKKAQKKRFSVESDAVNLLKDPFFRTPQSAYRSTRPSKTPKQHRHIRTVLLFSLLMTIGITIFSFIFLNRVNRAVGSFPENFKGRRLVSATAYPERPLTELYEKNMPDNNMPVENRPLPEIIIPELQGIMYSDKTPHAVIGGAIFKENDIVKGFSVKKIFPDKVVLETGTKETTLFIN